MGVTRWQWMGLGGGLATLLSVPAVAGAQRAASDAAPFQTPPVEAVEVVARPAAAAPLVEILDLERVLRGEGRGLTADEVAARALETAPSIEQGRAVLQQARSGASQAYLAFFPRLDLTARYTRLSPITQGTLTGGSLSQDDIAALRALIGTVTDPSAQALFNVNLESQLALANFSFPVLLDSFSFGAQLQYPVIHVFTPVLPSYEGPQR